MNDDEIWSIWDEVIGVNVGINPVPFARAILASVPDANIEKVAQILACEIECGIFEQHVIPALDVVRKTLLAAPTILDSADDGESMRPVAITEAMAEEMGETGAPYNETERKLYEAYCKGHCWAVGPWTGKEYYEMLDRIRFAMWRDRAALATRDAAPIVGVINDEEKSRLMARVDHIDAQGYVHWKKSNDKTGPGSVSDSSGRDRGVSGTGAKNDPQLSAGQCAIESAIGKLHNAKSSFVNREYAAELMQEAIDKLNWISANPESFDATPAEPDADVRNEIIEECAMVFQRFADSMIGNTDKGAALRSMAYTFADDIRALARNEMEAT